jgi:hypothetical protein
MDAIFPEDEKMGACVQKMDRFWKMVGLGT